MLGGLIKLAIAVPAVAFLISPLRKKASGSRGRHVRDADQPEPAHGGRSAIVRDHQGPDGRLGEVPQRAGRLGLAGPPAGGSKPEVIAFTAECPHLGCAINLAADGKSFLCPCHTSAFDFDGKPQNQVPPRPMDRLDVELTSDPDPEVRVKFQRFRTLAEERIPLV